jgi:hypothetical protein
MWERHNQCLARHLETLETQFYPQTSWRYRPGGPEMLRLPCYRVVMVDHTPCSEPILASQTPLHKLNFFPPSLLSDVGGRRGWLTLFYVSWSRWGVVGGFFFVVDGHCFFSACEGCVNVILTHLSILTHLTSVLVVTVKNKFFRRYNLLDWTTLSSQWQ